MSLTLSVTDNQDGTGGVATIAGTLGASVSLLSAVFTGQMTGLLWVNQGSRTGDGTLAVSPGNGYYLWMAQMVLGVSGPVYQNLTNASAQGVHYRCLYAVQSQLVALNLPGLAAANIVVSWLPRYYQADGGSYPGISISPQGNETQPGILTGRDDIGYPVSVAILDNGMDQKAIDKLNRLGWRQSIMRAFRHQRLPGVTEVLTTDVEPNPVIDAAALGESKPCFRSAMTLRFRDREVRGFGT